MYGNITIPGGIGLTGGETADKETQDKLKKALKGVTAEMNITGNAGTATKLAKVRKIGSASFDGSGDITLDQIGAAAADHTHPAQTSVTGNAGTADKLKTARKIGNASFDGSADITLSQIGAATTDHTHTAQTSVTGNAGTADKLKTARKIGNASFDGSADITLSQIGAAAAGHTHTAQTSVTGNAGTATKLATARKITITGAVSGNVTFDGSKDVTLTVADMNLPVVGSITLRANNWTEQNGAYRQNVTIPGLTLNHQVDLHPDYATEEGLPSALYPVNDAGTFYVVTGEPPETNITVQYTMFLTQKA